MPDPLLQDRVGRQPDSVADVLGLEQLVDVGLSAAVGHVRSMIAEHNFAPRNAGYIFWYDILAPAFLIVMYVRHALTTSCAAHTFLMLDARLDRLIARQRVAVVRGDQHCSQDVARQEQGLARAKRDMDFRTLATLDPQPHLPVERSSDDAHGV